MTACEQAEAAQSNQGCEFWAVDLPNAWVRASALQDPPQDQDYAIVVANTTNEASVVSVFIGNGTTPIQQQIVGVDQIATFVLGNQLNTEERATTTGTAYRVEASQPITVYQFNPLDNTVPVFSNDASLVFPSHVLANDYTAVTGDGVFLGNGGLDPNDNSGAFVTIVANEDNTVVDIQVPNSVTVYPGTLNPVLNRGQTYTVISSGAIGAGTPGRGNLSGTRIAADKPVAVFSGSVCTIEPQPGACCADHVEHQMLPLIAWGAEYVTGPAPSAYAAPGGSDSVAYRITGSFDGTTLTYSPTTPPGAPTTINAYQTVRFQTSQAFTVNGSQPFAVTKFLLSNGNFGGTQGGQAGDPAMIALPAVQQFQDEYVFLAPNGYQSDYVTIFRPSGLALELDGVAVTNTGWLSAGNILGVNWEWKHVLVSDGSHRIVSTDGTGFGIIVIGYDADVSYGYPGGSGVEFVALPPEPG